MIPFFVQATLTSRPEDDEVEQTGRQRIIMQLSWTM
jgi:hypothetical protein